MSGDGEKYQALKKENKAILCAMSALSQARDNQDVFNVLVHFLKEYVAFEHALVLTLDTDTHNCFHCLVSTSDFFCRPSMARKRDDFKVRAGDDGSFICY